MLWVSCCHVQIMWIICGQGLTPFGSEPVANRAFAPESSALKSVGIFANKKLLKISLSVSMHFQDALKTNREQIIFICSTHP